jgi:hypothetical protein
MRSNWNDQKLCFKGTAAAGTIIFILDTDTDEILVERIRVRGGSWYAEIEDVDSTLENIAVMMSSGMQLVRRSKIVKMPMMIMMINVTPANGIDRVSGIKSWKRNGI